MFDTIITDKVVEANVQLSLGFQVHVDISIRPTLHVYTLVFRYFEKSKSATKFFTICLSQQFSISSP